MGRVGRGVPGEASAVEGLLFACHGLSDWLVIMQYDKIRAVLLLHHEIFLTELCGWGFGGNLLS